MSDLIKREDAIEVAYQLRHKPNDEEWTEWLKAFNDIPSADRPSEIIYGNEHNCMMTIFGECSYAETGCGDCAVVEKVRKALSADRPQGEWIDDGFAHHCSICGKQGVGIEYYNYCPNCGSKMRGEHDD
jgi:hypothetical protein